MKDKRKKRHTRANSRKKVVPGRGSMGEEIRKLHGSLDSAMQSVRGYSMDNEAGMDDSGLPMKLLNFDGNYSHMGRGLQAGNKHQKKNRDLEGPEGQVGRQYFEQIHEDLAAGGVGPDPVHRRLHAVPGECAALARRRRGGARGGADGRDRR